MAQSVREAGIVAGRKACNRLAANRRTRRQRSTNCNEGFGLFGRGELTTDDLPSSYEQANGVSDDGTE
jgi:hypothetical protein